LEKPDSGSVFFDGTDIAGLSEEELIPVRQRVAMLFQGGALFDSMSVYENVAFPIREHTRLSEDEISERVLEKLAAVRLQGIENRLPAALSGGMKKRVALARSLALNPQVVLFDEPTTGLDPMTSATIANLIQAARRSHDVTSVVVTHDLALVRVVADRLAFLENGRFRFLGTWSEAESSSDSLLGRFLAGEEEEDDDS
jgi:phospholipid/cholesterol/gamma-HCH transport system ATP-binding protein